MTPYRIGICPRCGKLGTQTRHYPTRMIPGDGWLVIHIDGDDVSWCWFAHNREEEEG